MTKPTPGPRFFLITNRADMVLSMLWCHAKNLPASIAIVEDPFSYAKIPDGAECRGFWHGTRDQVWAWKGFWDVRRLRGGIVGISEEDWGRIMQWVDKNRRETLTLLYGPDLSVAAAAAEFEVSP
jgi:hypothetical protein